MSSVSDVCAVNVQSLYLEDPGNKGDIAGYVSCSEMGNTCVKNGCSCRSNENAKVNGTTKYFGVCVVLKSDADCVTSGDTYVTCATGSSASAEASSSKAHESPKELQNESNVPATTSTPIPNTKASTESNPISSGSTSAVSVSSTAVSNGSMSMTVMVVIIVVAVVFVAVVSWVVRSYCVRRSDTHKKLSSRRQRNTNMTPRNGSGTSTATPSFPAFDQRSRAAQSPTASSRGRAGNREPNSARGRRNPDTGFARVRSEREPMSGRGRRDPEIRGLREPLSGRGRRDPEIRGPREPLSGRGRRDPEMEFGRGAREPTSGRGRMAPDVQIGRVGREPNSGRGRKTPDMQYGGNGARGFGDAGMQREPTSGRGRRSPEVPRGLYQVEPPSRPDWTPPRDQRVKQHASPRLPPPRAPLNNAAQEQGGTVYTGRSTYDRVAQFAQLAAFEAPPPPPPRPQRPIHPVPVTDAVPKYARGGPAPNTKPTRAPAPKPPGFYLPEDPVSMEYTSLSPKTARSMAPSVASSATTIVAPGRNRPTPLQQGRRQPYTAPSSPPHFQSDSLDESQYDSQFESKFDPLSNYEDSFVSEVSSMAWSGASGLSDDSYYHAAPSSTARIPVIDAPDDDDEGSEADNYSDWGNSTHASDAFRSTAASDASFFSVNSDFTDTRTAFKEREF